MCRTDGIGQGYGGSRRDRRRGNRRLAVHIGARVAALGIAGEVLVTRTVKDLTAGSGIEFQGRGTHVLRGVPGDWELFAAKTTEAAG